MKACIFSHSLQGGIADRGTRRHIRKICLGIVLILVTAVLPPLEGTQRKITLDFFSPRGPDDMFWSKFTGFMQEAVNDLDMTMNIHYAYGNHLKMVEQVRKTIEAGNTSVLVFQNFKKQGPFIMRMAEEARIPAFVVNAGFQEDEDMGKPREKYKYWIGELVPDDVEAGYRLAMILSGKARRAPDGKIHMVALSGNIADNASIERVEGLKRAVRERNDIILEQVFSTNWSGIVAREKFCLFKKSRYPQASVIWAAGDAVALGVVEGAWELGCKIGSDIITGGIDWSQEGLEAVKDGNLYVSIGGHFIDGAWAAVLIHDYFMGHDFAEDNVLIKSKMFPITKYNADTYLKKLQRENWSKVNFRSYSRVYNPSLRKYNFNLSTLLIQM